MVDPYSNHLQLWNGRSPAESLGALTSETALPFSYEHAHQLAADESLCAREEKASSTQEPCSLQWFLDIENLRHKKYGRWIPNVLEFTRHNGETLLGMGPGLGTDWVQFARHGASVIVASPTTEHLLLVRRNFELRGLHGQFLHAPTPDLPLAPSSIDVVCMNSLPSDPEVRQQTITEVFRALKPGGKVLAVVPSYYDIELWRRWLLPWEHWWIKWRGGSSRPSPSYTRRELTKVFHQFGEHRVHKRHLRRADVPHLWRVLSLSCLERLVGRVLILKAFKPLSTAIQVPMAA
mgnify:CR=1 FL=1